MSQLESKKHLIYILGTFAFLLFSIADTIIKLIGDLYKDTVIFSIASFSALIPVLVYLLYRKSFAEIKTKNYRLHFVRGILMTLTYYLYEFVRYRYFKNYPSTLKGFKFFF